MNAVSFDKQKISDFALELTLGVDWKRNKDHVSELMEIYAPFIEIAACWSNPGDYSYLTKEAEALFSNYFKDIKRADMVQSKELIPIQIHNLPNTYVISITLDGSYLGMLLVHLKESFDIENLKIFIKGFIPQLSLAKYGTMMAAEVEKRTSTDKLTGLWNRNYFNERFREECVRLSRTKEQGVVVIISFDELLAMAKVIGSEEYNKLIVEASNLVRRIVRKTDWIVYWDKHEILVYLTNTNPEASIDVMVRCTNQLISKHPLLQPLIGLCSTSETNAARALIQLSTRRLELARKDGRKLVVCFATREGLRFMQLLTKVEEPVSEKLEKSDKGKK